MHLLVTFTFLFCFCFFSLKQKKLNMYNYFLVSFPFSELPELPLRPLPGPSWGLFCSSFPSFMRSLFRPFSGPSWDPFPGPQGPSLRPILFDSGFLLGIGSHMDILRFCHIMLHHVTSRPPPSHTGTPRRWGIRVPNTPLLHSED
jgi:hypothetical protein